MQCGTFTEVTLFRCDFRLFAKCKQRSHQISHQISADMSSHSVTTIKPNTRTFRVQEDVQGQVLSVISTDPP